jgi:hypothetical protein
MGSMRTDESTLRGHLPLPNESLRLQQTAQLFLESMYPQDLVAKRINYSTFSIIPTGRMTVRV